MGMRTDIKDEKNVPVSGTDKLTSDGKDQADHTRKFGEYKPTNTPLPAVDVEERRKRGWLPRKIETIHDLVPLEEHDAPTRH